MRVIEIIQEAARGLLYRSAGDTFKNPQGQEISFVQVAFVPSQPGKYNSHEEMLQGLEQLKQNYPSVEMANNPTSRSKAFAVIEFQDVNNPQKKLYFVRFFDEIKHDMSGAWKNDGLPGEWQLQKASSLKASYKLKPNDIIPAGVKYDGTAGVLAALQQFGKLGQEYLQPLQALTQGQLPVFPGMKDKQSAIQDDLGETIAPCAILEGLVTQGGIVQAQQLLLNGGAWSDCTITFPKGRNAGLIDSYLNPPVGPAIGISSKGEGGAKASVSNVISGLSAIRVQAENGNAGAQTLLSQNSDAVHILDVIRINGQVEGPMVLAMDPLLNLLTQSQADLINDAIKNGYRDFKQLVGSVQDIRALHQHSLHIGGGSRRVDVANPRYNIGYHILAGLARQVASHVNHNVPGFGNFCLICINSSPLIQVHMSTAIAKVPDQNGKQVEAVTITGFDTIYPPKFKGKIELDASKSYYATSVGGKLSFGFKP